LLDRSDIRIVLPKQIGQQPMVIEVQLEGIVSKGCRLRNKPSLPRCVLEEFADPK
jgi:hypothetical protein